MRKNEWHGDMKNESNSLYISTSYYDRINFDTCPRRTSISARILMLGIYARCLHEWSKKGMARRREKVAAQPKSLRIYKAALSVYSVCVRVYTRVSHVRVCERVCVSNSALATHGCDLNERGILEKLTSIALSPACTCNQGFAFWKCPPS